LVLLAVPCVVGDDPSSGEKAFHTGFLAARKSANDQGTCKLFEPKKEKAKTLERAMDPRAIAAIAALKNHPEFKAWADAKPQEDVREAMAMRKMSFEVFEVFNKRAILVDSMADTTKNAMEGKMRELVGNRLAYDQALAEYYRLIRSQLSKISDDFQVDWMDMRDTASQVTQTKEVLTVFKLIGSFLKLVFKSIKSVSKLLASAYSIRNLRNNAAFATFKEYVVRQVSAELWGYIEDYTGGVDGRPGALPRAFKMKSVRRIMMENLIQISAKERHIMKIRDAKMTFPIPDTIDVSRLVCPSKGEPICANATKASAPCKLLSSLCAEYMVVVEKEQARQAVPEIWKTSSMSSEDMSASLRAALLPHGKFSLKKGLHAGEWSCLRKLASEKEIQNSYECTLFDAGSHCLNPLKHPGCFDPESTDYSKCCLGFLGFKEAYRLAPSSTEKTCVSKSRTKTVTTRKKICCPKFQTKCAEEKCSTHYNQEGANVLYSQKREKCEEKKTDCQEQEPEVARSQVTGRTPCEDKYDDCVTAIVWNKDTRLHSIVNKHTDVTALLEAKKARKSKTIDRATTKNYCRALWRNSYVNQTYSVATMGMASIDPLLYVELTNTYPAETIKTAPLGVDTPATKDAMKCESWPDSKWGLAPPTREMYCREGCQDVYPKKKGCPISARMPTKGLAHNVFLSGRHVCRAEWKTFGKLNIVTNENTCKSDWGPLATDKAPSCGLPMVAQIAFLRANRKKRKGKEKAKGKEKEKIQENPKNNGGITRSCVRHVVAHR